MITATSGNRIGYESHPKISYVSILFLTIVGIMLVPLFVFLPISIVGLLLMTATTIPAIYLPYWKSHKEHVSLDIVIRAFGFGMIPGYIFISFLNVFMFLICMVICFPSQTESLTEFFANNSWRADPISMLVENTGFGYYMFMILISIFGRALPLVLMEYMTLIIVRHSLRSRRGLSKPEPFAYSVYLTASILGYNYATTIVQMIVDSAENTALETSAVSSTLMLAIYTILSYLINVEIVQYAVLMYCSLCASSFFKSLVKPLFYLSSNFFIITFIDSFHSSGSKVDPDYSLQYIETGLTVVLSICVLWYIRAKILLLSENGTDLVPIMNSSNPVHIVIPNDVIPTPVSTPETAGQLSGATELSSAAN